MKSGESFSTKYFNEYLFRRTPSIFHVIEEYEVTEAIGGKEDDTEASTVSVDLSKHGSLNMAGDYQGHSHQRKQWNHHLLH